MTTTTAAPTVRARRTQALVIASAVLAGSGVVAGAGTASAHAAQSPDDVTMREVSKHVLGTGAPGYLARIDNGRRVSTTTAGLADISTGRKLRAGDQFEIGSNTKTFMSTLTLQLVDQGRVGLDQPVQKYLPGVVPNGANITVRMLLNHTSGLFSYTGDEAFFARLTSEPEHVFTEQELLDVAFSHDPDFAPGTSWNYSNTNYTLIGLILQKQTGKSLAQLVQQRIVAPLGLRHTYFADPYATNTGKGYAHGYAVGFTGERPTYTDTSAWPIGGWGGAAGAVVSDADDTATFFSAVLSGKLFSQKQLNQMKQTVDVPADYPIRGGYGLGIFEIESACGPVWGHGGDTLGHHSTAIATADGRRTAVSDTTAEPGDTTETDGATRFAQVAFAAQDVTACRMLGKPVPQTVADALRGLTPAS
ncbi:serine hydrolase domain-containing protein [Kineosporia succinea]|uniref:D-alanyl-D-alanine carboxypeptidase n=1 Tax=Kineosporia succinea TaxID=84632 RepID=A0ABT9PEC9_9ACTN|nr:serine hydrolase domain-containing protein [Kineosporia succinea]MDP9831048.1 D-alanyl-D-alanine carboxypeptidase [Kineosporia succinea]